MSATATDTVTLAIDGREVVVPKGTPLVIAAATHGVEIPIFCYEPRLGGPVGACRMCLVEIEGMPKLQAACTMTATDGMKVHTRSEKAAGGQEAVLEFLLLNHPLDCPVCDKGGECPLQDLTFRYGPGNTRFNLPKRTYEKPIAVSPLIALDRERCILCYRCTRFSQEVAEDEQLITRERGAGSVIATFEEQPYRGHFSGNVVELCPVGALTATTYRFRARPWEIVNVPTVCGLCPTGCNTWATVREGRIERVLSRNLPELDEGWLCDKGRFATGHLRAADRRTTPLARGPQGLAPTTYAEAAEQVALRMRHYSTLHGPGAVAIVASGEQTSEEAFGWASLAAAAGGATLVGPEPADAAAHTTPAGLRRTGGRHRRRRPDRGGRRPRRRRCARRRRPAGAPRGPGGSAARARERGREPARPPRRRAHPGASGHADRRFSGACGGAARRGRAPRADRDRPGGAGGDRPARRGRRAGLETRRRAGHAGGAERGGRAAGRVRRGRGRAARTRRGGRSATAGPARRRRSGHALARRGTLAGGHRSRRAGRRLLAVRDARRRARAARAARDRRAREGGHLRERRRALAAPAAGARASAGRRARDRAPVDRDRPGRRRPRAERGRRAPRDGGGVPRVRGRELGCDRTARSRRAAPARRRRQARARAGRAIAESRAAAPAPTTAPAPMRAAMFRPMFSGPAVERSEHLAFQEPRELVLNRSDAQRLGITAGQELVVRVGDIEVRGPARISRALDAGAVRVPYDGPSVSGPCTIEAADA